MMLPAIQSLRIKAVRADLEFEATRVVCALKSYQLTHDAPPEQLADLVPTFLPSVNIDPFDGKPLRYRREGKEWVIWSVGSDLKDDNAACTNSSIASVARNVPAETSSSSQPNHRMTWPTTQSERFKGQALALPSRNSTAAS